MLDRSVRPWIDQSLTPFVLYLDKKHIRPNQVTALSFLVGLLVLPALVYQWYELALVILFVNRLLSALDGALARHQHPSELGAFFDSITNLIIPQTIILGFLLSAEGNVLWAGWLMLAVATLTGSQWVFAMMRERNYLRSDQETGVMSHFTRLVESGELFLFFVLSCVWPIHFNAFASVFFFMCGMAAVARIYKGYLLLKHY